MNAKKARHCRRAAKLVVPNLTVKMTGSDPKFRLKRDDNGEVIKPTQIEKVEKGVPYRHTRSSFRSVYKAIKANYKNAKSNF